MISATQQSFAPTTPPVTGGPSPIPPTAQPQTTGGAGGMDPQAIALAQAIRQHESGGNFNAKGASGENGAYQWLPSSWSADAKQVLGDANAPMTPANQNAVAYTIIKGWKDEGLNPAAIASRWNSGSATGWENKVGTNSQGVKYDVPAYVKSVTDLYQQYKGQGTQMTGGVNQPAQSPGPSVSGFIGNVASSAGNLVSGLGQAAMHPIDTASNILGSVAGAVEKPFGVQNEDTQKFDNMVNYFGQRYGGNSVGQVLQHIGSSLYNDPIGVALDVSTLLDGFGGALGAVSKIGDFATAADAAKAANLAQAADFISTASGLIKGGTPEAEAALLTPTAISGAGKAVRGVADAINPISLGAKAISPLVKGAGTVAASVGAKLIGLNTADDVANIIKNYQDYSKSAIAGTNRASLAEDFGGALDKLDTAVSEGGSLYKKIAETPGTVSVPTNWIQDVLQKGSLAGDEKAIPFGLSLTTGEDGKLVVSADSNSFTRNPADIKAIQSFVDNWGGKTELTAKEFINMRSDLSKLSKFGRDIGKNDAAELVSRSLRAEANKYIGSHIPNLRETDALNAPLINQYKDAFKNFLTRSSDGTVEFKPGALNKIANATGKGKDALLAQMEKISPGITGRIETLKTIESIESAYNIKVGAYGKAALEVGGLLTGNMPAVIAAIVSHPAIAIPLLRGLGWSAAKITPMLAFLRQYIGAGAIRNAAEAGKITASEKNSKP